MGTSPKIYQVAERPEPGESEKKEFAIYDQERMERIRQFLSTSPGKGPEVNFKGLIDNYKPLTYDVSDFTVNISPRTESRFVSWYNSNVCVKMLMTFERNYLSVDFDSRKTFERQAFLIEHVTRLRELYNRVKMFDNLVIRDVADFKHLALFFEQIAYFMCYNIDQTAPLSLVDIKNKIFNTFYDLCNDITDISSFEDIHKIMTVDFDQYSFEIGRTSLQPSKNGSGVYTFNLMVVDQDTKESFYQNFTNEDYIDLFEPGLDAFLKDPIYYEEYRSNTALFNPFSNLVNKAGDLPF